MLLNMESTKTAGFRRATLGRFLPNPNARLQDQVHEVCRFRRLSGRTQETYWGWIRRFLRFHRLGVVWRHPKELGAVGIRHTVRRAGQGRQGSSDGGAGEPRGTTEGSLGSCQIDPPDRSGEWLGLKPGHAKSRMKHRLSRRRMPPYLVLLRGFRGNRLGSGATSSIKSELMWRGRSFSSVTITQAPFGDTIMKSG